ncbi:MAG: phosphocholine cytidylyltransferase family protein [Polyangiaceae bacterium]|nr:phosphocholine cytidylyltransferase family protein [Polyangiaceae bacterium]
MNAQAIVLAAGEGTRLRPHTADLPKCLVQVGDRPLLERALTSIEQAGIGEAVLVTGYRADRIEEFLARRASRLRVRTVFNPDYATTNNAVSLWCARALMTETFVLLDGDLLFEPEVLRRTLVADGDAVIAVERRKTLGDEEMKVLLHPDGTVAAVNKQVDPAAAVGEAIGIARFGVETGRRLFAQLGAQVAEGRTDVFYEKAFEELMAAGQGFRVADVSGLSCMEIDTPEDLDRARRLAQEMESR